VASASADVAECRADHEFRSASPAALSHFSGRWLI